MKREDVVEKLRGIGIAIEGLMEEIQEPDPHAVPKFKKGDVIHRCGILLKVKEVDTMNYTVYSEMFKSISVMTIKYLESRESVLVLPQWNNLVRTPDGVGEITSFVSNKYSVFLSPKNKLYPNLAGRWYSPDELQLLLPSEAEAELEKIRKGKA